MPTLPRKDEETAVPASDVVLVAFDGVEVIDIAGPASVFSKAELLRPDSYRLHIASPAGGTVMTNGGLSFAGTHTLRQLPAAIDTRWTQDRIASHSGFGSVDALQRAFARQHGLTPQAYRDGERRA